MLAAQARAQRPLLAEAELARPLEATSSIAWQGQQTGAAISHLADVHRLPLWIDRRLDPTAEIELTATDLPVRSVFDQLCEQRKDRDWGWTTLRTVVYFGPRDSARELATLSELARQAIAKAPADQRRRWLTPAEWKFPRLSEPRALLEQTVADIGAELRGVELVPHDLWAAKALPAIAPTDRVVLLLAGFDLTIAPGPTNRQLRVEPIKRPVHLVRTYPATAEVTAAADALTRSDEGVEVRRQGRQIVIAARWEVHAQLRPDPRVAADASTNPTSPRGERRFTLKIEQKPVGRVLEQLAAQLQIVVEWDPNLLAASPAVSESLVSCDVREVDLDGLLRAIIESAGLKFERREQSVTIRSAKQ